MSQTLPFTKKERKACAYQGPFGRRPTNNWGSGELPAPFADGDIVEYLGGAGTRMQGWPPGVFIVAAGFSIGEGDDWYFRVTRPDLPRNSDRLHVIAGDVNYMSHFRLVDTADPDGLARRERLLADGWTPPTCEDRGCWCDCHSISEGDTESAIPAETE